MAPDQRAIPLVDRPFGKRSAQGVVGRVGLGDHDQSRGFAVQAVDDTRSIRFADRGEPHASPDQAVDQGPALTSVSGVDRQPGRLVHDQQIVVLVDDVEREFLGLGPIGGWCRNLDTDRHARLQDQPPLGGGSVIDLNARVANPTREPRSRDPFDLRHQEPVESLTDRVAGNTQLQRRPGWRCAHDGVVSARRLWRAARRSIPAASRTEATAIN